MISLRLVAFITVPLAFWGCSKNKPAEEPSSIVVDNEDEFADDEMEMMQEFGGLNEEKVTSTFKRLYPELSRCLTKASETHRFLSGDVAFLVKVNLRGQAEHAHIEKSNLGSYEAERCMAKILRGSVWPKPVGGKIGLARWSIGFDAPADERPPVMWDSDEVTSVLDQADNASARSACGGGGPFEITAYVEPDGQVSSAGVAHVDDSGEETAACLVRHVENTTFDSPGSWRAKVSFPY